MVTTGTAAAERLADWLPYEPEDRCTAVVDAVSRVEPDPAGERRRAWSSFTR